MAEFIQDDIEDLTLDDMILMDRLEFPECKSFQNCYDYIKQSYTMQKFKIYQKIRKYFSNFSWKNLFDENDADLISGWSVQFRPQTWSDIVDRIQVTLSDAMFLLYLGDINQTVYDLYVQSCPELSVMDIVD